MVADRDLEIDVLKEITRKKVVGENVAFKTGPRPHVD
jgi:hypothetical protein